MNVIRFWTTAKGNLPHLSYIFHKTKPLGTEFNTVNFSDTGELIFIEVHKGKEGISHRKYHQQLGFTVAFTKRTTEATKGIGQKYRKGATKDCFLYTVGSPQISWQNM